MWYHHDAGAEPHARRRRGDPGQGGQGVEPIVAVHPAHGSDTDGVAADPQRVLTPLFGALRQFLDQLGGARFVGCDDQADRSSRIGRHGSILIACSGQDATALCRSVSGTFVALSVTIAYPWSSRSKASGATALHRACPIHFAPSTTTFTSGPPRSLPLHPHGNDSYI